MDQTSTPITTRLTIVTEGRAISDDTQESIITPNTGIINSANVPMIFGGALLLIAIFFVFFKNRRKTGFRLSKKHTLTISVITVLTLFGLLNAAPKLSQPEEAKAAKVQRIEADYLTIDAASAGELTLNLDDFESDKIAYIKDTITVNEDIVGAHTIDFAATVPEDIPFSEALVYTTSDPTAQDTTWQTLPADKTIVVDTDTSAEGQTYDIYYGINPVEIPAGTYTIDISYDANITFDGTMQSMNQTICQHLPLETRFTLKDVRDDKEYRIIHLADDSCWMIDDLALELSTSKTLTSADTDLNTKDSWTPNKNTMIVNNWSEYWNNDPCNDIDDVIDYEVCRAELNISVYDEESRGYYYNWSTATATDLDYNAIANRLSEEELYVAKDSICPKGWQLPLDAHYNSAFDSYRGNFEIWSVLRLLNGDNEAPVYPYPMTPILTYEHHSINPLKAHYFYGDSGEWGFDYDDPSYVEDVRCVLNYSGEATLTIGSNTQTAPLSRAGADFTIPNNIPTRDGYTFWGYAAVDMEQDAHVQSKIIYLPGRTYTFYAPHTVLYPIWEEGYPVMQYIDNWAMPTGLQVQAIDTRDNKLYWIARLKDGNIWMTQNLDYDIKATDNIVSDKGTFTSYWSPGVATSTSLYNNDTNGSDNHSLSYDPGDSYIANGTGNTNTNTPIKTIISCTVDDNSGENCHYHKGNYYQWNAATAGSGNNTSSGNSATRSICPAGWVLPFGDEMYDVFTGLFDTYNVTNKSSDTAILAAPFYFTRAGYVDYGYYSGQLQDFGNVGYYWTSTKGLDGVHSLSFDGSGIFIPSRQSLYEGYGNSVRCVAMQKTKKIPLGP